jgi:FtsP/CotA-like multicopper oxidase with cupredoxin domain
MKTTLSLLAAASAIFGVLTNAAVIPSKNVEVKRASCENTATSRDCWGDYDLSTNWQVSYLKFLSVLTNHATFRYDVTPVTGVIREYWLSVENVTIAPDGFSRFALTYNGTIPGPALIADWGDTFVVHVTNHLTENGTTTHFHGMRQLNNSEYDGVPGISQCPIAPGQTMTYTFPATQYGSTWYHSHYSLQYADGLYGPLIINGPSTANYDEDLGALMIQDWDHTPAEQLWDKVKNGGPPSMDNTLINGTAPYDCTGSTNTNCIGGGKYFETEFVAGTSYKIRVINVGVDMTFRFQIDAHDFQVVAADLVPIVPYTTDNILVGIGQRYEIIVNANATNDGNYWLRAGTYQGPQVPSLTFPTNK